MMMGRRASSATVSFVWIASVLAVNSLIGCATTTRSLGFLGGAAPPPDASGPAVSNRSPQHAIDVPVIVTAQGWIVSGPHHAALSLEMTNHGARPIRLSYVVDEYVGMTRDGRRVVLEKRDFLSYPDELKAGQTQAVSLQLPKDVPVDALTRIVARLNMGQVVLTLVSVENRVSVSAPAETPRVISHPAPEDRAPVVSESAPRVVPSAALPPADTVPVEVTFQQELGGSLRAEVRWNDSQDVVTLTSGTQQIFYVAPGRHQLHLSSRLPFIAQTQGQIPVSVRAGEPLRIALDARARLTGVELRVRVWEGHRLITDQALVPSLHS